MVDFVTTTRAVARRFLYLRMGAMLEPVPYAAQRGEEDHGERRLYVFGERHRRINPDLKSRGAAAKRMILDRSGTLKPSPSSGIFVMAGQSCPKDGVASARQCPAIHVFSCLPVAKTWMPGTRPGMTSFTIQNFCVPRWCGAHLCCGTLPGIHAGHLDAVVLLAMFTTCTRRLTSARGLAGSLSLLLPYPTVTRSEPAMPYLSTR